MDTDRRRAARIATLVAVPVTLLAGVGVFNLIGSAATEPDRLTSPTDPVTIEVPDLSEDQFEVCRALISVLPDDLNDHSRRPVEGREGAAEVSAAWGEPAVTLVCGVDPVEISDTDQVFRLDKVCWLAQETETGSTWTTVDREKPVRLTVPADHDGPGQLAKLLSEPVVDKVPAADEDTVPTGCYQ